MDSGTPTSPCTCALISALELCFSVSCPWAACSLHYSCLMGLASSPRATIIWASASPVIILSDPLSSRKHTPRVTQHLLLLRHWERWIQWVSWSGYYMPRLKKLRGVHPWVLAELLNKWSWFIRSCLISYNKYFHRYVYLSSTVAF